MSPTYCPPLLRAAGVSLLLSFSFPTLAAFVLLDDFNSGYSTGELNGQNGWTSQNVTANGNTDVVDNAGDGAIAFESVGTTTGDSTRYYQNYSSDGFSIADGTIGTFYYEFTTSGRPRGYIAIGSGSTASGLNAALQITLQDGVDGVSPFDIQPGDAGSIQGVIEDSTAYSMWLVVDRTAGVGNESVDVYIQGGTGIYATQTQIGTGLNFQTFWNQGAADINNVSLRPAGVGSNASGTIEYDNFYVDTTGENLTVIPELSSVLQVSVALIALGFQSRRRIR